VLFDPLRPEIALDELMIAAGGAGIQGGYTVPQ